MLVPLVLRLKNFRYPGTPFWTLFILFIYLFIFFSPPHYPFASPQPHYFNPLTLAVLVLALALVLALVLALALARAPAP